MELSPPLYAAYLGGFLIIIQTVLALIAGAHRGRKRKPAGYDNDVDLERKIRRHANMAEYAPIFITVLALFELIVGQTSSVFWLAVAFAISRVLHVISFSSNAGSHLVDASGSRLLFVASRMIGTGVTLISSITLGVMLLVHLSSM